MSISITGPITLVASEAIEPYRLMYVNTSGQWAYAA